MPSNRAETFHQCAILAPLSLLQCDQCRLFALARHHSRRSYQQSRGMPSYKFLPIGEALLVLLTIPNPHKNPALSWGRPLRHRLSGLMAPGNPAFARLTAEELELRQLRIHALEQLIGDLRFLAMLSSLLSED